MSARLVFSLICRIPVPLLNHCRNREAHALKQQDEAVKLTSVATRHIAQLRLSRRCGPYRRVMPNLRTHTGGEGYGLHTGAAVDYVCTVMTYHDMYIYLARSFHTVALLVLFSVER